MRRVLTSALAAAVLAAALPAQAALSFKVTIVTHSEAAKGATAPAPADTTVMVDAALGERYLSVQSAGRGNLIDFDKRIRYVTDEKSKTYVTYSLYDTVGFRAVELQHRTGMARALVAAKIDGIVADPLQDEHVLSLQAGAERKLDQTQSGDGSSFSIDGKLLARASGGTEVSTADGALFARFLRYQVGGHPLILARLTQNHRVPDKLVLYFRQINATQEITMTFAAVKPSAPAALALQGYARHTPSGDGLDALLERAAVLPVVPPAQAQAALAAAIDKAFAEQRVFEGLLGALEMNLATGIPMPAFAPPQRAALQADPSSTALLRALAAKDKETTQAAVATFQNLRPKTMGKQYMLKLFEANDRAKLGEPAVALELLTGVVRANPALAGAYKDLGDKLFGSFDMANAWRSWDAGRRMVPALNLFEPVNKLERELAQQHPEYF